jgi:hypothetical protein
MQDRLDAVGGEKMRTSTTDEPISAGQLPTHGNYRAEELHRSGGSRQRQM